VKSIKLKINKPLNCTWDELGFILRELRYTSSKMLNYTIQKCYEWHNIQLDHNNENDIKIKDKDYYGCSISTHAYRKIRENYNICYSGNVSQTVQNAIKRWKNDKLEIMRLQKSIPSYKLNAPIFIANQSYKLEKLENNEYSILVGLLSKEYTKNNDINNTQYKILLQARDNSTKTILDRIINKDYKYGSGQITYNKRKKNWFIIISYENETKTTIESNTVMGIDLGIKYPLYIALNNSKHRYKIEGGEIEQFRKQIEKRKLQLLHQGKYCANGRKGHGITKRISPLEFANERVSNFRNTTNHKYSHFVIEIAKKHNVALIQMENLTGISEDNKFLKNWSYFDLQNKIKYKANLEGIKVEFIDPYKTSQRCSKCGHIDRENRLVQSEFICVECGEELNADYNAARNISTLDIENIIKEKCNELEIVDSRKLRK